MKTVKVSERKLKLLERDADRYRFLRKAKASEPEFGIGVWLEDGIGQAKVGGWLAFDDLDKEIVSAMRRAKDLKNIKCRKGKP